MADHPNATMARAMWQALESGDMETVSKTMSEDIVWHEIGSVEPKRGMIALAAVGSGARDFELSAEVHDVIANDEHIVALLDVTAKRAGKILNYRTAEILHVKEGKVTERWAFSDDTAAITAFFA